MRWRWAHEEVAKGMEVVVVAVVVMDAVPHLLKEVKEAMVAAVRDLEAEARQVALVVVMEVEAE